MSEKVNLKTMRCPTCGAPLKAENGTDAITCVYCGNTIVPVTETTPVTQNEPLSGGFSGVIKVEGIKTSSSALAYIEQFFEEYDWEAFAYAQTLSITEIDTLADSLKVSSADDKNTWFVCFKAISVPFIQKVFGCKNILNSVIAEYKKENLDAYSKFDAYKRLAAMISNCKSSVVASLEKFSANAAKYGAAASELEELKADIDRVNGATVTIYGDIEHIPEIKTFIQEKNAKIVQALAAEHIDAEEEYSYAKHLIAQKKFVEALGVLLKLKGYSDTDDLIEEIDKYYLIGSVLEIEGNLYYFKKEHSDDDTLNLYPTVDGKIAKKPLITNIGKIITNYADILYYLDGEKRLRVYNLGANSGGKIYDKLVNKIFVYGRKVFLVANKNSEDYSRRFDLIELDTATAAVRTILENIESVTSLTGNKLVFKDRGTLVINVDTMEIVRLGAYEVSVEGFVDNYVVYTIDAPNDNNQDLYIKALNNEEPERLIERNIYQFCDIIADKLFYYIGNSHNETLININCDGSDRKEWPMYISDVLFEQGGWLYFIRKAGYNSILCKAHLDGSKFSIIAADIEKFVGIKNGYLYYINDVSALVRVRMDGSNLQKLCGDVKNVLSVKEDKIIFVSVDDRTESVESIYAVDFSGSGKIKLAYNISNAKEYDENTVYYMAEQKLSSSNDESEKWLTSLFKLDVTTNYTEKLLDLEVQEEETESHGFTVAMILMGVAFFCSLMGFAAYAPGFATLNLVVGFISLLIGICIKVGSNK